MKPADHHLWTESSAPDEPQGVLASLRLPTVFGALLLAAAVPLLALLVVNATRPNSAIVMLTMYGSVAWALGSVGLAWGAFRPGWWPLWGLEGLGATGSLGGPFAWWALQSWTEPHYYLPEVFLLGWPFLVPLATAFVGRSLFAGMPRALAAPLGLALLPLTPLSWVLAESRW